MKEIKCLFVGEQPSQKAARYGHTWQNRKAAGHTLAEALKANNINPDEHEYTNLWDGPRDMFSNEGWHIDQIRRLQKERRLVVVALGQKVARCLSKHGIHHLQMVHPAARGKIRKRERYQEHVGQVLNGGDTP